MKCRHSNWDNRQRARIIAGHFNFETRGQDAGHEHIDVLVQHPVRGVNGDLSIDAAPNHLNGLPDAGENGHRMYLAIVAGVRRFRHGCSAADASYDNDAPAPSSATAVRERGRRENEGQYESPKAARKHSHPPTHNRPKLC